MPVEWRKPHFAVYVYRGCLGFNRALQASDDKSAFLNRQNGYFPETAD
jgi:hypothetical protein